MQHIQADDMCLVVFVVEMLQIANTAEEAYLPYGTDTATTLDSLIMFGSK